MLSIIGCFDSKIIKEMELYVDSMVHDIPNDPLSMWYVFYKWKELHGDDLIIFARYAIGKAIDYGAVPAINVRLKKKEGELKARSSFILCKKCGEDKNNIIDYVISVWISLGDRREFLLENSMDSKLLTSSEYKTMDTFLWGFRFALPEGLTDISMVDPDDLIKCENDIWGI